MVSDDSRKAQETHCWKVVFEDSGVEERKNHFRKVVFEGSGAMVGVVGSDGQCQLVPSQRREQAFSFSM